ncbi:MAG: hypothetical protein ACTHQM_17090 [Thermoanaerobaculia bacterium]
MESIAEERCLERRLVGIECADWTEQRRGTATLGNEGMLMKSERAGDEKRQQQKYGNPETRNRHYDTHDTASLERGVVWNLCRRARL